MFVFAREPIFDAKQSLFAYHLVFRDSQHGELPDSKLHTHAFLDDTLCSERRQHSELRETSLFPVGLDDLLNGFSSVVGVPHHMMNSPTLNDFSASDTILEIKPYSDEQSAFIDLLDEKRSQGFRVCIDGHTEIHAQTLVRTDFLKIDVNQISLSEYKELLVKLAPFSVKTIASNIESQVQYEKCVDAGFDYYQGLFFLNRQYAEQEQLPTNKLSLLKLLAQTSNTDINMDEIRITFEQDATLSYLLLRFINSPMINKSHKISSIKHALSFLGELMLRKFVAIISVAQLNENNVDELLQVSLVRAKYCERLDQCIQNRQQAMSAFMLGLLSLIDVILDRDMGELLAQLPLSSEIHDALVKREGYYHELLASIKALESSAWLRFKSFSQSLDMSEEAMHEHYLAAVKWNNEMRPTRSSQFPQAKPKA